jgi:hypothetical protein
MAFGCHEFDAANRRLSAGSAPSTSWLTRQSATTYWPQGELQSRVTEGVM